MTPAKKKATAKTSVKFRDLRSKKNPKGGLGDETYKAQKQDGMLSAAVKTGSTHK
jgi:hypothetical protein